MGDFLAEMKKCAEAGAEWGAAGASIDAASGGATMGGGAAVGGIYGCMSESEAPEQAAREVGRFFSRAWDELKDVGEEIGGWFGFEEDSKQPREGSSLETALFRTAWHLEHRRRFRYEYCEPHPGGETGKVRWETAACNKWRRQDVKWVWPPANRGALYGKAGVVTPPEVLYRGLAMQFVKLRARGDKSPPLEVLAKAIKAYGDFLSTHYPAGQTAEATGPRIDDWEPTPALRRRQAELEQFRQGFVPVKSESDSSNLTLWLAGGAAALAAGGLTLASLWR